MSLSGKILTFETSPLAIALFELLIKREAQSIHAIRLETQGFFQTCCQVSDFLFVFPDLHLEAGLQYSQDATSKNLR